MYIFTSKRNKRMDMIFNFLIANRTIYLWVNNHEIFEWFEFKNNFWSKGFAFTKSCFPNITVNTYVVC